MSQVDAVLDFAELMRRARLRDSGGGGGAVESELAQVARLVLGHQKRGASQQRRIVAARRSREAVVKIVRRGGAMSKTQLARQLDHPSRQGDVRLEASDAWGGWTMSAEDVRETISGWAEGWFGKTNYGHTRHIIAFYPKGTDAQAAHQAGRLLAERAFAAGQFGDAWDYVTASTRTGIIRISTSSRTIAARPGSG